MFVDNVIGMTTNLRNKSVSLSPEQWPHDWSGMNLPAEWVFHWFNQALMADLSFLTQSVGRFSWPALNNVWKISQTCEDFYWRSLKKVWHFLLTCDVCQIYQWNMLLRWQLSLVSETLQTLCQDKPFIFVKHFIG